MLSGVEHGISKVNIVVGASRDLDFSLSIKRERMRAGIGKGYTIFGIIETIYFEPDEGCRMDLEDAEGVGRRLHWPENGPAIARSIPEQDLLIPNGFATRNGRVVLPDVPDVKRPSKNPYKVDARGISHLAKGENPIEAPKKKQVIERIASKKFLNFLIFQPISQIITITVGGQAQWAPIGSYRMPISSLTGFDGTKMALLVDPYTGEAFFKGGRYDMADRLSLKG
jgi:hypothetical protein